MTEAATTRIRILRNKQRQRLRRCGGETCETSHNADKTKRIKCKKLPVIMSAVVVSLRFRCELCLVSQDWRILPSTVKPLTQATAESRLARTASKAGVPWESVAGRQ